MLEIWGGEGILALPYAGKCLYGLNLDISKLVQWPFNWTWNDAKGHTGAPDILYTKEQIQKLVKSRTLADLVTIDAALGNGTRNPKIIARDLVKSIKPGILIEPYDRYGTNHEVILNVPTKMRRLAVGSIDAIGNNRFLIQEIEASLENL